MPDVEIFNQNNGSFTFVLISKKAIEWIRFNLALTAPDDTLLLYDRKRAIKINNRMITDGLIIKGPEKWGRGI